MADAILDRIGHKSIRLIQGAWTSDSARGMGAIKSRKYSIESFY